MPKLGTEPGLRAYYLAATAARIGDEMVGVAVVLLVLERTGSPQLAGAVAAAYLAPAVVSGPLLGAWLDVTRYRRAALATGQVVLGSVMVALVAAVGDAPAWGTIMLTAAAGVTVPMTSGGFTSLLPRLVSRTLLPRAHAVEGVSFNAAAIVGPATAATAAAAISPAAAVLAIVGFAILSLGALAAVPAETVRRTGSTPGVHLTRSVRRGLGHVVRSPALRSVTLATSTAFLGLGTLTVALPLRADGLAGEAAFGGYLFAAIELGAVVTALAWGRWHARWKPERVVLASLAGMGLVMFVWPLATAFAVLLVLALAAGLANGAGMPALFTTRQRHAPAELYAQVTMTGASLKLGAFAVGAALGGQLVAVLGVPAVLALAAAVQILAAGAGAAAAHPRPHAPQVPRRRR